MVIKGSVPGVPKRLVKLRHAIREINTKIIEPKVLEVVLQ
jgi:large subunit ribosomal protein L3